MFFRANIQEKVNIWMYVILAYGHTYGHDLFKAT